MIDFTDLGGDTVAEFADGPSGETVTRRRFGPSAIVNRNLAQPAPVELDVRVFAPPAATSTRRATTGSSAAGELVVYTVADFRAADEATGSRGDQIVRGDGSTWSVERVDDYLASAGFLVAYATLERPST